MMEQDKSVVACTAAMPDGTGVKKALDTYPDRTWDTGICESHAMDMMAGMAKTGLQALLRRLLHLPAAGLRPGLPGSLTPGTAGPAVP